MMAQDERRAIMETGSRHNAIGMEYLPEVARRLHHCRDIGGEFDRPSEEWGYVACEVDIRLLRD